MRALCLFMVLMACRPSRPAQPFTLRVAVSGSLDKVGPESQGYATVARTLVFERLVGIGQAGEVEPALAAKVVSAGPLALRVWLRADARFSDGSPVTFADIAAAAARHHLNAIDEGKSILFRSEDSSVPPELLMWQVFVSRAAGTHPLGTGPFVVEEQDSAHILLRRRQPVAGFIDRVLFISYPTPQDAFVHTLKGDADMLPEVDPRSVEFFEGVPRTRILRANSNMANTIIFNVRRLSREERLALVGLIAADDVRRLAFGNDCTPPRTRPETEPLPAGRPLDILATPILDRFAVAARRALGARGGEIHEVETRDLGIELSNGHFDLATIRPPIWPPIMTTLLWRTGAPSNLMGYSNPAVDAALDARDWKAAQRALDADPPAAVVCSPQAVVVLDARIKTPPLEEGGFMESLPQWEVQQ